MNQIINLSEVSAILEKQVGNNILIKTGSIGFTFKSFAKIEEVNKFTGELEVILDNGSTLELDENNIERIVHDTKLSRNNTQTFKIKMNNNSFISIEFEIN